MPNTIWNGPGMPGLSAPKQPIAQMRQQRNHFKIVRRGQKWVVRAKFNTVFDLADENTGAFKIRVVGDDSPNTWNWTYLNDIRKYDFDYWFNTKQEALMFLLKCNS